MKCTNESGKDKYTADGKHVTTKCGYLIGSNCGVRFFSQSMSVITVVKFVNYVEIALNCMRLIKKMV